MLLRHGSVVVVGDAATDDVVVVGNVDVADEDVAERKDVDDVSSCASGLE